MVVPANRTSCRRFWATNIPRVQNVEMQLNQVVKQCVTSAKFFVVSARFSPFFPRKIGNTFLIRNGFVKRTEIKRYIFSSVIFIDFIEIFCIIIYLIVAINNILISRKHCPFKLSQNSWQCFWGKKLMGKK